MKKMLISMAGLFLLASVILLFVNAAGNDKESRKNKKAQTELKKDLGKCNPAAACKMAAGTKNAACDPQKCKEMNCDKKTADCDPTTCPIHKEAASAAPMKGCCAAKSIPSCPAAVKEAKE